MADSIERGFPFLICSRRGRLNTAAQKEDVTVYNAKSCPRAEGGRVNRAVPYLMFP